MTRTHPIWEGAFGAFFLPRCFRFSGFFTGVYVIRGVVDFAMTISTSGKQ